MPRTSAGSGFGFAERTPAEPASFSHARGDAVGTTARATETKRSRQKEAAGFARGLSAEHNIYPLEVRSTSSG